MTQHKITYTLKNKHNGEPFDPLNKINFAYFVASNANEAINKLKNEFSMFDVEVIGSSVVEVADA